MGTPTKQLQDLLSNFILTEIGSKAMDGITYAFVTKEERDIVDYNNYMFIRTEADNCGYNRDEVFRVYEVSNGYIFDMDISIARMLFIKIAKAVQSIDSSIDVGDGDIIGNKPEERRKHDIIAMAKYCKSEFDKGNTDVNVALFSRNGRNYINITGKDTNGQVLMDRYNAYAIRHWDIEVMNRKLLIPAGLRIATIEPFEILPSKTGVKFGIHMEAHA